MISYPNNLLVFLNPFYFLIVIVGVLFNSQAVAYPSLGNEDKLISEKLVDLQHLEAYISIDTISREVNGTLVFKFEIIRTDSDSVVFSASDFHFATILLDQNQADYWYNGSELVVRLPRRRKIGDLMELRMEYTVTPASQLYFVGFDDSTYTMRRQIWAHRPYAWLPYTPGRITQDLHITFSSRYKVFSNGIRKSIINHENGTSTWHYSMEHTHPFFSMALVIGDYRWKSFIASTGLEVELWYYPEREHELDATYMLMDEMLQFCEQEFGVAYPYELYRQAPVADYLFGGMETTTSTIFGDYMHIDNRAYWERNYVNVNIHELVHQWFGNYISHLRPFDVWLTEGFATFYAKLFEKEYFGINQYDRLRIDEIKRTFDAAASDDFAIGDSRAGSDRWYAKASLVLDMLRDELGRQNFRRVIQYYLQRQGFGEAWTADLIKAIYDVTGRDLQWFFEQWIFRGGEPYYYIQTEEHANHILMKIEQTQTIDLLHPPFRVHLKFETFDKEGSRQQHILFNDQQEQLAVIPKSPDMLYILFDPGHTLIKKYDWERDKYALFDQLINAGRMIERWDALLFLREIPIQDKLPIFADFESKHSDDVLREEVLSQISSDSSELTIQLFKNTLTDTNVLVRRAALTQLQAHHKKLTAETENCLKDISYTNIILALNKLAILAPENMHRYLEQTKNETGFPGKKVRIAWLKTAISFGQTQYLNELIDLMTNKYDFTTRIHAIEALVQLNYLDYTSAGLLVNAANHWNTKLSSAAKKALDGFSTQNSYQPLIEDAGKNYDKLKD
ncbi:MAG: hypothetical protein M0Q41_06365 [Bacteroidales bacterium]|nr:hypothetical protein [Bacteroidales bacterium]